MERHCLYKHRGYACLLVFESCGGGGLPSLYKLEKSMNVANCLKAIKQNDSKDG